jgi:antitoxin component YwqK of YwqJK toxin-antitoxin module
MNLLHQKYWFFLIISVLFFSCQGNDTASEILIKDGLIYKAGESEPFTGRVSDVVKNKKIEYDVVDGIKHGEFKVFHENGMPEIMGIIKKNKNDGLWKYFYPSGKIESEGLFKNDLPDGKWKWYYQNGSIREEGNFSDGSRIGEWIIFEPDGKVKTVIKGDSLKNFMSQVDTVEGK